MLQPNLFWYYDPARECVCASISRRTKFRIRIVGNARNSYDGVIMIPKDQVTINVDSLDLQGVQLKTTGEEHGADRNRGWSLEFPFSNFDGGFGLLQEDQADSENNAPKDDIIVIKPNFGGERWDLCS